MGFKENDRFGLFGLWYAKDMHSIRCSRVKIGKPLGSSFAYTKCFPFLGILDYSKTTCPRKTAVLFGLHALDHWHGQELWIPEGQAMNRLSAASVYSKIGYQWTYGQTKWALTDHPRNQVSRRGNESWKSSSKPLVPMTHWPNWRYDQHVWWFDPSVFVTCRKSLNSQFPAPSSTEISLESHDFFNVHILWESGTVPPNSSG